MALVSCMTARGMDVDIHDLDDPLAAKRAVCDALHHSSLGCTRLGGTTADDMTVYVTIEAPRLDIVKVAEVADALPYGHTQMTVVAGGLERLNEDGSHGTLIANAIIPVSFDDELIASKR
jgi:uncharacterized protein (TIGR02058 family)